ncbi:glycoside hydrolase family 31 protein [Crucibulum laeve]|uniref:beta-glucosidase n=1 Tax=Crucibulum laeve TaxID=68775 RepID=A0A5C3LEW1_9AGAR|nr:glycoside hydrolase family 31 protein [Crucibulum laeve]
MDANSLTAEFTLASPAYNVFGEDVKLALSIVYETADRIHLKITDPSITRFEVPTSIFPHPSASRSASSRTMNIQFTYTASSFSFTILHSNSKQVLLTTKGHSLIFEPQYLRLKTDLPKNPNVYGLGEHTNPFRLPESNTTVTLWSRDAYGIPTGSNLYGNHPVYYEHRSSGTHGVFLLNANGMDIKLTQDEAKNSNAALEYNVIGGVLDFYFLAGSTTDPEALPKQYAQIVGLPAEYPYWSFGFQQCRFGYKDYVDVAGVISSYAEAQIPLEVMWTDIDYMDRRRIFTTEPDYFPILRVRKIVDYLNGHDQKYILMTDPAVAYVPSGYPAYDHGKELNIYLKSANGSDEMGVVWPGVTVFPDWFHPNVTQYWNTEFKNFYSPETGIDIDGAWIDMNEPANFCAWPCTDPFAAAIEQDMPPARTNPPPAPDVPIFTNTSASAHRKRDLIDPPYKINNAAGSLSNKTASTNSVHYNNLTEYDTHNLYGTMMSFATHTAMLARRPSKRPFIITRSTFAGAGSQVGKWLGDNLSLWEHYRFSVAGMLGFASVYQVPMVGSDICGFGGNTTETLCARWATLGAFYPFMRNMSHNSDTSNSQEFYRWPTVAEAAKNAIDIRYRLLDYIYTAFHQAHTDGTPVLHPVFFKYSKDPATFGLEHQFFFGDSILVSPVTEENSTSVTFYIPKDRFYDFKMLAPVDGQGSAVTLDNVSFTEIPLHIKSGVVLPLREKSQMTTTLLRKTDFELVVAPTRDGKASGSLYIDDGESIEQPKTTEVEFAYQNGKLDVKGKFGYETGVKVARVRFAGVDKAPKSVKVDGRAVGAKEWSYDSKMKVLDVQVGVEFKKNFSVQFS